MTEPKYVPYSIQVFSDECYYGGKPTLFLITNRELRELDNKSSWYYGGFLLEIGGREPFPGFRLDFSTTTINVTEDKISPLEESVSRLFPQLEFPKGPPGGAYR